MEKLTHCPMCNARLGVTQAELDQEAAEAFLIALKENRLGIKGRFEQLVRECLRDLDER